MKKLSIGLPVLLVLFFSGCANTGVVLLGENTYYISDVDGSPGFHPPSSDIIMGVFGEAHKYCSKKGMKVKKINQTLTPSSFGKLASVSLEFSCVK